MFVSLIETIFRNIDISLSIDMKNMVVVRYNGDKKSRIFFAYISSTSIQWQYQLVSTWDNITSRGPFY